MDGRETPREKTCCFTGHRSAKLPWGANENDPRCLRLKPDLPDAVEALYEAAVPCPEQDLRWSAGSTERYDRLLSECDKLTVVSPRYSPECMMRRNRYMVDRSGVVIAVFNGSRGGTFNTLRYAVRCGLEIIEIDP